MKNLLNILFAVFVSMVTSLQAAVQVGRPAPDFTLTGTSGEEHSLSDFAGKYVILEWTNHKCPFVVKHYKEGHMQSLQKQMVDDGAVWLQIVSSAEGKQGYVSAEQGEALRKEKEMNSTAMLIDASGKVGREYGARTTPHMYLISPKGVLLYQGAIDSNNSTRSEDIAGAENYLLSAYESAKEGKQIENASTVPYGCGIKYQR